MELTKETAFQIMQDIIQDTRHIEHLVTTRMLIHEGAVIESKDIQFLYYIVKQLESKTKILGGNWY